MGLRVGALSHPPPNALGSRKVASGRGPTAGASVSNGWKIPSLVTPSFYERMAEVRPHFRLGIRPLAVSRVT
jgi:hypothetical protein